MIQHDRYLQSDSQLSLFYLQSAYALSHENSSGGYFYKCVFTNFQRKLSESVSRIWDSF